MQLDLLRALHQEADKDLQRRLAAQRELEAAREKARKKKKEEEEDIAGAGGGPLAVPGDLGGPGFAQSLPDTADLTDQFQGLRKKTVELSKKFPKEFEKGLEVATKALAGLAAIPLGILFKKGIDGARTFGKATNTVFSRVAQKYEGLRSLIGSGATFDLGGKDGNVSPRVSLMLTVMPLLRRMR